MRAYEFLNEAKGHTKISKRKSSGSRGMNVYSDAEKLNNDYSLNRVMMAVACSDGKNKIESPMNSFVGKLKSSHPYTEEEQDMLKAAYKAAGVNWEDLNKGDFDSSELESTQSKSPVKPFKGYKK